MSSSFGLPSLLKILHLVQMHDHLEVSYVDPDVEQDQLMTLYALG